MSRCAVAWPFIASHADAFLRLEKVLTEVRGFALCLLVFSDSTYRDRVSMFLAEQLRAQRRVTIDRGEPIGTEELFSRLGQGDATDPVQLFGVERWPTGLNDLLGRLNLRREALAERCQRPLLVWTLSTQVKAVATRAADLWAWRSGVFSFALPKGPAPTQALDYSPFFSLPAAEVANRRDRIAKLHDFLAKPVLLSRDVALLCDLGALRLSLREVAHAADAYGRAQYACVHIGDAQLDATVKCGIADVLEARDELAEAQRVREEQVPVFHDAGDIRATALAQLKIADVLRVRGRLAEALSILVDEVVPTYERLQDYRSRAIALDGVADIHFVAGRLDEALRIHQEERLPVFRRLGERWRQAQVHSQIATVLLARGQFDDALRTMTTTVLPMYDELGDVHASTVAKSRVGDIHQARGELDAALRIRMDMQLPVFERLGDIHSDAITRGQIATIWQARGDLDEALRWCEDEEVRLYEQIGDKYGKAVALGRLAGILRDLGQLEDALRVRCEKELPLYERLGDLRGQAIARKEAADVLAQLGRDQETRDLHAPIPHPIDEAYGVPLPRSSTLEYVLYEREGVLFEGRLADPVASTYKSRPVGRDEWRFHT